MSGLSDLLRNPFSTSLDLIAFALYLLVFPVYHMTYPFVVRWTPLKTRKGRIDLYRRSWIELLVENRKVLEGAQQTRNLTMVASFLASSALILLGVTGNVLLTGPSWMQIVPHLEGTDFQPQEQQIKLYLLMLVFSVTFMYFMASLRHIGHFVIMIGADPKLIEKLEGVSAVEYITRVINLASNRYTLGTRCLYSALPVFLWLFSTRLFLLVTLFSALKFMGLTDFARRLPGVRK